MAKKTSPKPATERKPSTEQLTKPWIKMRTALVIIIITSIGMAVLTGFQAYQQQRSLVDSILLGLVFGGLIWVIFLGNLLLNRWLRREKK